MSIVIFIAPIYYIIPEEYKINLFGIDEGFTFEEFIYIFGMYLVSMNTFLIVFNFRKKLLFRIDISPKKKNYNRLLFVSIIFTIIDIILLFIVFGVEGFYERNVYIPQYNKVLEISRVLFTLLTVVLIALLFQKYKKISIFLMFTLILFEFSTGSRKILIYLVLYLIITLPYWKEKLKILKLSLYILLVTIFISIVLTFRDGNSHGFYPYFIKLIDFNILSLLSEIYFLFYYIFIFGFNITIHTVSLELASLNTLLISINPLPGGLIGWEEISKQLKVNKFSPTNLYGELYTLGYFMNIVFFFILGNVFYIFERFQRNLYHKSLLVSNIILFMILFFTILSYEYQLRSATRFLYYLVFIILCYYCINLLKHFFYKRFAVKKVIK